MVDTDMTECPELPESNFSMSNFDQQIDDGMETDLRNGYQSAHNAWNFYGLVWFENGMFHEEVKQYRSHMKTISATSLKKLMNKVNNEFGYR